MKTSTGTDSDKTAEKALENGWLLGHRVIFSVLFLVSLLFLSGCGSNTGTETTGTSDSKEGSTTVSSAEDEPDSKSEEKIVVPQEKTTKVFFNFIMRDAAFPQMLSLNDTQKIQIDEIRTSLDEFLEETNKDIIRKQMILKNPDIDYFAREGDIRIDNFINTLRLRIDNILSKEQIDKGNEYLFQILNGFKANYYNVDLFAALKLTDKQWIEVYKTIAEHNEYRKMITGIIEKGRVPRAQIEEFNRSLKDKQTELQTTIKDKILTAEQRQTAARLELNGNTVRNRYENLLKTTKKQ